MALFVSVYTNMPNGVVETASLIFKDERIWNQLVQTPTLVMLQDDRFLQLPPIYSLLERCPRPALLSICTVPSLPSIHVGRGQE